MNDKLKKALKYILSLGVAVLLLWFSFKGVKWGDFLSVLKECNWLFVGLSMLAGALAFLIRSLRWRLLLLPVDETTKRTSCFDGVNIGNLANFVVPHMGEIVRCGYIVSNSKKHPDGRREAPFDMVFGTVLLERVWDVIMLFLLIIALLIFRWDDFGNFFMEKIVRPVAGDSDLGLFAIIAGFALFCAGIFWGIWKFRERSRLCARIVAFVKGLWTGMVSFTLMRNKLLFLLETVILWTLFVTMTMAIIYAIPGDYQLGISDALFLTLVGAVASIVPVPGGFGAFHYMIALSLLSVYDVAWETGIVFATLSHETQAITMVILGLISYAVESLKKKN